MMGIKNYELEIRNLKAGNQHAVWVQTKNWFRLLSLFVLLVISSCSKQEDFTPPYNSPDLIIPTSFSPNNDGLNDSFVVSGAGISYFEMRIFDNNNAPIFVTNSLETSWNGTYKNEPMPEGSYFWTIIYRKQNPTDMKLSGYVALVR